MRISDIKIDKDFKDCLPELSTEEYTNLDKSIAKYGVNSPLIIWKGFLVDGHNRLAICKAHGMVEVPVKEISVDTKESAIEWILSNQLSRRNLTDYQRNVIALKYKEIIQAKMKERMSNGGGDRKSENRKIGVDQKNNPDYEKTSTRKELAKIAGTNESSIQKTELILAKGTDDQKERAMRGGKGNSLSAISKEISHKDEPQRECCKCGCVFPISKMNKANGFNSYICKPCDRIRSKSRKKNSKSNDSINATIERMKSGKSAPYTRNDVYRELVYAADGLVESWTAIIQEHRDIVDADESVVGDAIMYLSKKFKEGNINVKL